MRLLPLLFAAAVAVAPAAPAAAETVAVTNGRLAIGDGSPPVENGTVLIRDGRVVAAGQGIAVPADARRIDAGGKWVTPGLVAGFSTLGLTEVEGVDETNDVEATGTSFSAGLDVAPAVNAASSSLAISRARGVTRAIVVPGDARFIFAGLGALIDTGADPDAVFAPRAFEYVELGETGAGKAGGSRAASFAFFRNAMLEVRDYMRNPAGYGGRETNALLMRLDVAALVPVLNGDTLLLVHVERASDILQVLALRIEFPKLRLVIVGAAEGWLVADRLAAAHVPVLASALTDLPEAFETLAATESNIGRMERSGVQVALAEPGWQPRNAKQSAGNLVALLKVPGATGVDWDHALAAITSGPADAMGMGKDFGSLRPGRRADLVIWDGDPLELESGPVLVMIDGVQQSLETRQSRLRDRYRDLRAGDLPPAYRR